MTLEEILKDHKNPGDPQKISELKDKIQLPSVYKEFLTHFCPQDTLCFVDKRVKMSICLEGLDHVLELFDYSGELVVATEDLLGDFFIMELSEGTEEDAPIYYQNHDDDLAPKIFIASNFLEFLEMAIDGKGIFDKIYKDDFEELVEQMNR